MAKRSARPITQGGRSLSNKVLMEKKNGSVKKKSKRLAWSESGGKVYSAEAASIRVRAKEQMSEEDIRFSLELARLANKQATVDLINAKAEAEELAQEEARKLGKPVKPAVSPAIEKAAHDTFSEVIYWATRLAPYTKWNINHGLNP